MITTNFLKRNTDSLIDFSTDIEKFIDEDCKYVLPIRESNPRLYGLIKQAVHNGLFMRNTNNKKSFNYWQPLSNAGLPAVPRGDFIHELTFFIHDVLHNLVPDLQIGDSGSLHKKVYTIYRLLGEGICLVLADMYFVDELRKQGLDYDFEKKNIYQGFYPMREKDFKANLKANAIFAATGDLCCFDEDVREDEGFKKYVDWFSPVYISDLNWTLHNANCQLRYEQATSLWRVFTRGAMPEVIAVERTKLPNTNDVITACGLDYRMSTLVMADRIFEWIYGMFYEVKSYEKRDKDNAKQRFYCFQSKIAFDYGLDTGAYLSNVAYRNYEDFDLMYQRDLKMLLDKRFISQAQFDIYSEIYPHFDSCFISYSASRVADVSLKDYANHLYRVM